MYRNRKIPDEEMRKYLRPIATILILISIYGLCTGTWNIMQGIRSTSWPSTSGVIQSSSVDSHRRASVHTVTSFTAHILYNYTVAGNSFSGSRVAFSGPSSGTIGSAKTIVDRYPKGKTVNVFYSPNSPESAVLETGTGIRPWVWMAVSVVLLVLGLVMFWAGIPKEEDAHYGW